MRLLHRDNPSRYPFLLQSTTRKGELGRFDILFAFPGDSLELRADGQLRGPYSQQNGSFLDTLDAWWQSEQVPPANEQLPFLGGWFLYLGYELAAKIEPGLRLEPDRVLPCAFAVRCATALVFDHHDRTCYLVCESRQCDDEEQLRRDIDALVSGEGPATDALRSIREQPSRNFIDAVNAAKGYIAAGDIYQANLSRQWTAELQDDWHASDIYGALCASNPGPFAGIARFGDVDLVSSSPERLLRIRDGVASTRPIAGTRPRSTDSSADSLLSEELLAHPKEIAEHVMLVDLERNDLGRICEPGSVQVDEMMVLETYAHVHHIVSNISGRLRAGVTPGQAIAAVFPGGTITGAPKVRCMEIIGELEDAPRGAYTGSIGYLNRDGSMDLNILIRTMVKQGSQLSFRAGSGIVADSDAIAELEETRAKAKGMLGALTR
ncbi:MAG: aminodeoxychorismate synthase component I [Gammaproteobacteria bacterium]|nr:aminodeoxychorismate synthase component I [Gammaproteobacteria bacterium]